MVSIPRRGKDPYLTAFLAMDDDIAIIAQNPYILDAAKSKFGKERTVITIKLKRTGELFRWTLNGTSNDNLLEAFGSDGDLWLGKEVKIKKRIMNVRGEDRHVLYATPSMQTKFEPAEKQLETALGHDASRPA